METKKIIEYPKVIIFHATDAERDKIVTPALSNLGYSGKDVWVVKTGIGKVNATIASTLLLSRFAENKTVCINVGVCGGSEGAYRNNPCISTTAVVDGDINPFVDSGTLDLTASAKSKPYSLVITADSIRHSHVEFDGEWYSDSELFGIAKVCNTLGFQLKAIKSISEPNFCGRDGQFEGSNFDSACTRASDMLEQTLVGILG